MQIKHTAMVYSTAGDRDPFYWSADYIDMHGEANDFAVDIVSMEIDGEVFSPHKKGYHRTGDALQIGFLLSLFDSNELVAAIDVKCVKEPDRTSEPDPADPQETNYLSESIFEITMTLSDGRTVVLREVQKWTGTELEEGENPVALMGKSCLSTKLHNA